MLLHGGLLRRTEKILGWAIPGVRNSLGSNTDILALFVDAGVPNHGEGCSQVAKVQGMEPRRPEEV
ncbi:hypothetical protein GQ600_22341 [Phytophthora cactorum]|nr:hypothetical protein GQ600_22341 [Phytophthora cactorum]